MSIYKLCTSPPADKWLSDACMGLVLVLLDLITVCDTNLCVSYAEWQKIKKKPSKPSKAMIILSKDQQILYHFYHFVYSHSPSIPPIRLYYLMFKKQF